MTFPSWSRKLFSCDVSKILSFKPAALPSFPFVVLLISWRLEDHFPVHAVLHFKDETSYQSCCRLHLFLCQSHFRNKQNSNEWSKRFHNITYPYAFGRHLGGAATWLTKSSCNVQDVLIHLFLELRNHHALQSN